MCVFQRGAMCFLVLTNDTAVRIGKGADRRTGPGPSLPMPGPQVLTGPNHGNLVGGIPSGKLT